MDFELIPARDDRRGDFAVLMEDDSLSPYIKRGETAYLERRVDLRNGDIGLFYTVSGMEFRQFCEDCFGNVYLLTLRRADREADIHIAHGCDMPVCYGRLVTEKPVPLPED